MQHLTELRPVAFKSLLLCFMTITFLSCDCDKDNAFPELYEHFIFGSYACECVGQCAWLYQISNEELVMGEGAFCEPDNYTYHGASLSQDKFAIARRLIDEFPGELLENNEDRFGCPDCHDQGGYYIELSTIGSTRKWSIDTDVDDLPEFLLDYQKTIHDVLIALN
jgi:hypothetical protein